MKDTDKYFKERIKAIDEEIAEVGEILSEDDLILMKEMERCS